MAIATRIKPQQPAVNRKHRDQISKFTRVCSYDRAGFGWSDAPNEPRSLNIANEMDRLLTRAAVPGPYVLVGHDFGTLDLRVFTAGHRKEVAGMVFVDSVHPDMHHRPPFNVAAPQSRLMIAYHKAVFWSVVLGVPRLLGWCRSNFTFPNQPAAWAQLVPEATAQYCRLQSWRAEQAQVTDEDGSFPATTGPFGDMPLVVLSHDPQVNDFGGFFSPDNLVKAEHSWMEMQDELRSLSSRSQRIVAKGSEHWVQIHRPELVAAAVREIVNDARGTAPFQADQATEYR